MGEGEPDTESALLFSVAQGWGGTTFLRYLFICLYFIYLLEKILLLFPGKSSGQSFQFSHTHGLCLAVRCFHCYYYYYYLKEVDSHKEELMRVEPGVPWGQKAGTLKLIKHDSVWRGSVWITRPCLNSSLCWPCASPHPLVEPTS